MERRTFIASTPVALAGATTLGIATPAQAQDIGDRKAARRPETIAARQKVFGAENVDPATGLLPRDKMIASWLSNSSFALSVAGRVLYLDTYVTRLELVPGRTPFTIKDLVDVHPRAILLGHGHSDHADNAAYIAAKTGAMIYATEETCGVMRQDLERMRNGPAVDITGRAGIRCTPVTTTGSAPATQILRLDVLEPVAQVVAFRHLHSVAVPRDPTYPPLTILPEADPRDPRLFPPGISLDPGSPPLPGQMDLTTGGNPGGTASLFFQITMRSAPNFSVAYQDTAGALKEGKGADWDGTPADGQRITDILTKMSPADVFLGTVGTNNFGNNGLRDIVHYQQALKPRIFIPNHLTTGSRYMGESKSPSVYASYLEQLRNMGISETARARVRWLTDPMDYLRPLVYDLREPTWADHRKRARLKHFDRYPMAHG